MWHTTLDFSPCVICTNMKQKLMHLHVVTNLCHRPIHYY
jgi:hypothetical protein